LWDGSVFLPPTIETKLTNNPGADNGASGIADEANISLFEKTEPAIIVGESSRVKTEAIQEHKNILSTKPATPTPDEERTSSFEGTDPAIKAEESKKNQEEAYRPDVTSDGAISAFKEDVSRHVPPNSQTVPALTVGESSWVKKEAIQEHKNIVSTKPATPTPDEATICAFKDDITPAGLFLRDLVAVYKSIKECLGKSENKNWDSMYVEIDGELKHFFGEIVVPAIHNCFLGVVSGDSPEEIRFILQTELNELEQVKKSLY
jgi:hypothetical protein